MPRPKIDIRNMTLGEVEEKAGEIRKEIFNLRFRNAMRQLDNPLQIRFLRRDLARLETALTEHRKGIHKLPTGDTGGRS